MKFYKKAKMKRSREFLSALPYKKNQTPFLTVDDR